jgi:hypothetical protein
MKTHEVGVDEGNPTSYHQDDALLLPLANGFAVAA